jgi:pimeloyl-ACP methyl ester carboxylesterase
VARSDLRTSYALLVDGAPRVAGAPDQLNRHPWSLAGLAEELLPWVRRRVRLRPGPAHALVGGFSVGGRAAAALALDRPDLFGNVLAQSGLVHYGYGPDGEGERRSSPAEAGRTSEREAQTWGRCPPLRPGGCDGRRPSHRWGRSCGLW